MATQVTYVGDGATVTYAIPFDYSADGNDLNVTVDGSPVAYTLDNASTVRLAAPAKAGAGIRVFRKTPFENPEVVFADSSILSADDLNGSSGQLFRRVQEVADDSVAIAGRSLLAPEGEAIEALPSASERAGSVLVFDEQGHPLAKPVGSFPIGPSGPANSTYATRAELRNAPVENLSAILTEQGFQGVYQFTAGNFAGQEDGRETISSNKVALTAGAWRRQPGQGMLNVKLFGARGNGLIDDTLAIQAAIAAGVAIGWPVYVPSGSYVISDRLRPNSGIVGDGPTSTTLKVIDVSKFADGRAMLHFSYPLGVATEPQLHTPCTGFSLRGGGIRPAQRSANPASIMTNVTGIFFDEMCHSITATNVDIQFCMRGIDFGGRFGHLYATSITLSNNWFGAYFSADTGDYCIDGNSNIGGNQFASIGISGSTQNDGVHIGGVFGLTLRRSHGGFGPYVIYQEGGTSTIGLSGFTCDDFKFENVGNRAIYLSGGTTKITGNWRMNDIGHSWVNLALADEVASYVIQNDANHPIQDYAVVVDDIQGAPVIFQNGASFVQGTSGYSWSIKNLFAWLHDCNSKERYKVTGDGGDRLIFTGQPTYEAQTGIGSVQFAGGGGAVKELAVLQVPHNYANTQRVGVNVSMSVNNTGPDPIAVLFKVTTNAGEQNFGPVQYVRPGKSNLVLTGRAELGMPNYSLPAGARFPVKIGVTGFAGADASLLYASPDGIDSVAAIRITQSQGIV